MKEEGYEEEKEEDSVYEKEGRDELVDDDAIKPEEQGFMKGYDEADEEAKEEDGEESKKEEE